MSKFFNETHKTSRWSRRNLGTDELDVKEVLGRIKLGSAANGEIARTRLEGCRKVQLAPGRQAPLVLSRDMAAHRALEAYRGLRTRLMRAQSKSGLRSVAITSSQPGEGKTLTVMNLGLCYADLPDQPVLIIDADLRTRGLTHLLGRPAGPGLAEVLAGEMSPEQAIVETDRANLFALPAGASLVSPPELFNGARWQEVLGWCSETFKLVLVDTPPVVPLADFELISPACDGIVAVVRPNQTRRDTLQKIAGALDRNKLLGFVLNATETDAREYDYYGQQPS
jgi:capsular exopolysaccharide synthesis family protein